MPQFLVNKLIRDKLAMLDRWAGKRTLTDAEFIHELKRKLIEESQEVMGAQSDAELLEELADLQDVIDCLVKTAGFTAKQIAQSQEDKYELRGGFEDRIFVERIVIDEHEIGEDGKTTLAQYCRNQPHKYKET